MNTLTLAALVIGVPPLLAALLVVLMRRLLHGKVREGHNDVLVPMFLTAGTIYAVMLGFLVVVVWEAYGDAKDNVALEASTLSTLYRLSGGMEPEEQKAIRGHIREYTEAVISDEWQVQADHGGASPKARAEVVEVFKEFATLKPETANSVINQEFLHNFSAVAAARNKRTLQAGESVSWVMWLGLVGGAVIVVGMGSFLYMEAQWPHMIMIGIMSMMICMLLFITILLGRPFRGPLAVQPEPFEHSLGVYKSVDEAP